MKARTIESFELQAEYYVESWINGNKSHVKEEIASSFYSFPLIGLKLINSLPKDISEPVIDSYFMANATLNLKR